MGVREALRALRSGGTEDGRAFFYGSSAVPTIHGLTVEALWRTQPHLRTVVSFLARNIAHVGFHMYERQGETDRRRVRDDPFAVILRRPNDLQTGYDLIYELVSDRALYNEAFWIPSTSAKDGRPTIESISPAWVVDRGGKSALGPEWFEFLIPTSGEKVRIKREDMFYWPSYNPGNPRGVSSPIDALRQLLYEQLEAQLYRRQLWKKGGRFGGFLTRPAGARWDPTTRETFRTDWNAKFGPNGSEAGGTPILEDGMEYKRAGMTSREEEWLEGTKLAFATVANAYHVNPTMVGLLDNANFANVREFRRSLYGDTLGPVFEEFEQRMTQFIAPTFTRLDRESIYIEANIAEKLQGSFEEQTSALQSSVGRPWMTADEARALQNMPSLGGDAERLVTPLNVLIGGQSAPNDGTTAGGGGGTLPELIAATEDIEVTPVEGLTAADILTLVNAAAVLIRSGFEPSAALVAVGLDPIEHLGLLPVTIQRPSEPEAVDQEAVDALKSKGLRGPIVFKAEDPNDTYRSMAERVLKSFYERQAEAVMARIGAKAPNWWDEDRWNRELASDLLKVALATVGAVAPAAAEGLGFAADDFDLSRTEAYLKALTDHRAAMVNEATKQELEAAIAEPDAEPSQVFEVAKSSRSVSGGLAFATSILAFATLEVGHQLVGDDKGSKTWITQSANPRASHARMNGQTVPLGEKFSNGADMPGDPDLGAAEVAGCHCGVAVSF